MFTVILIMIVGMGIGYLLRTRENTLKHIDSIITWSIYLLLFLLGIAVGTNETILANIDSILYQVILLTLGAVLGSVLLAFLVYKLYFKGHEK